MRPDPIRQVLRQRIQAFGSEQGDEVFFRKELSQGARHEQQSLLREGRPAHHHLLAQDLLPIRTYEA